MTTVSDQFQLEQSHSWSHQGFEIGLAPMEGVSGISTRLWLSLLGSPKTMSTPFLRATTSFPHKMLPPDYAPEWHHQGALPYRLFPQIMAANSEDFLRAARFIPEGIPVEINCGCPAPCSFGSGAGSSLLQNPSQWRQMLCRIIDHLGPGRLAVKMRLGIHDGDLEFPRLLEAVADLPLYRLTVHGRTRQDRYRGHSRWDLVAWASRQVPVPVFASGDVHDLKSLRHLLAQAPQVGGVLIGRGALRNPWVFRDLEGVFLPPGTPSRVETHEIPTPRIAIEELLLALRCFYALESLTLRACLELKPSTQIDFFQVLCHHIGGLARIPNPKDRLLKALRTLCADLQGASDRQLVETEPLLPGLVVSGREFFLRPPCDKTQRVLMGRLKMFWNYMRSSLPNEFFQPTLLREKNTSSFYRSLIAILAQWQAAHQSDELPLVHNPHRDWMYAGEKAENTSPPPPATGVLSAEQVFS